MRGRGLFLVFAIFLLVGTVLYLNSVSATRHYSDDSRSGRNYDRNYGDGGSYYDRYNSGYRDYRSDRGYVGSDYSYRGSSRYSDGYYRNNYDNNYRYGDDYSSRGRSFSGRGGGYSYSSYQRRPSYDTFYSNQDYARAMGGGRVVVLGRT